MFGPAGQIDEGVRIFLQIVELELGRIGEGVKGPADRRAVVAHILGECVSRIAVDACRGLGAAGQHVEDELVALIAHGAAGVERPRAVEVELPGEHVTPTVAPPGDDVPQRTAVQLAGRLEAGGVEERRHDVDRARERLRPAGL